MMHIPQVLIVDDDPALRKLIRVSMAARGYETILAADGVEAMHKMGLQQPDLIILDINMPEMDGFEVCRRVREWSHVPIIMLSARHDESDKVTCLEIGADDYITKPFGINELVARVNAVFRRFQMSGATPAQPTFACDNLQVSFAERRVMVSGAEIKLTPTEFNLLQELVSNANKVLTHKMLLNKV